MNILSVSTSRHAGPLTISSVPRRLLSALVLVALLVAGAGCGKVKISLKDDEAEKAAAEAAARAEAEKRKAKLRARKQKLKSIAQERFAELLAKQEPFDREATIARILADEYKLSYASLPEPLPEKKEVSAKLKKRLREERDKAFPESKLEAIKKQAEKEFPLYKVGDVITAHTRRGVVKGKIEGIYPNRVKVGAHYILFTDITEPDAATFDAERTDKRRRHFVNVHFRTERGRYVGKLEVELRPKVFHENGYVKVGKDWMRIDEIEKTKVIPKVDRMEAEHDAEIANRIRKIVEAGLVKDGLLDPDTSQPTEAVDMMETKTPAPAPAPEEDAMDDDEAGEGEAPEAATPPDRRPARP